MAQKTFKLDIFKLLKKIDSKDLDFYDTLNEEEIKAFQPLVVMRWLSSNGHPLYVLLLNELVNPYVFTLGQHKKLLYMLMLISCQEYNHKFSWNKKKSEKKFSKAIGVLCEYLQYSKRHAYEVIDMYTNKEIIEMCEQLGYQDSEIKPIKKELLTRK